MRQMGITLRLGERVDDISICADGFVQATLQSGKHLRADALLYCIGRQGATANMGLEEIGLKPDSRGRLVVNEHYQTELSHIYAVGDIIGFPALASTSMEQGRLASCHAYGEPTSSMPELFPVGIFSIPEISMVGKTEAQLTEEGVPYEAGVAQYREIARGQLLGDEVGMLKLLIHEETRQILGVHAIGTGATELIHIGQAVIAFKGTVDYFINNVFNYPTLAECYKVAALNGSNKLRLLGSGSTLQAKRSSGVKLEIVA
jgi:NAD(P) transhydrogenase